MNKRIPLFFCDIFPGCTGVVMPRRLTQQQAVIRGRYPKTKAGTDTLKAKTEKDCKQGAIGDLFRKKEKAPKPPKKFMALILPNISSNPTNGFLLGVGGTFGWYMGPKENTRVSAAPFTVAVTSKKQLISFIKSQHLYQGK